jgi:hypothetical protein
MLNEMERLFLATTPKAYWQEVLRLLERAHGDAWQLAHDMFPSEYAEFAPPIYWALRRGLIEVGLLRLASRFPEISARPVENIAHNCIHAEVQCRHFLVTLARADEPGGTARSAVFRDLLAMSYQLRLPINIDDEKPLVISGTQAAFLQYGPATRDPRHLGFAEIVFPSEDRRHIVGRLNMVEHYAAPVDEVQVETIAPPVPQLRGGRGGGEENRA